MAVKVADRPLVAAAKMCLCGRRNDGPLDVCPLCMEDRRADCIDRRQSPNFKPSNPACNYGWHALVNDCRVCHVLKIYGTGGCKPCEKYHYCNEIHPAVAA